MVLQMPQERNYKTDKYQYLKITPRKLKSQISTTGKE